MLRRETEYDELSRKYEILTRDFARLSEAHIKLREERDRLAKDVFNDVQQAHIGNEINMLRGKVAAYEFVIKEMYNIG